MVRNERVGNIFSLSYWEALVLSTGGEAIAVKFSPKMYST